MFDKFENVLALLFYLSGGLFCILMMIIGAAVDMDAKNFLPAIAGVLFAVVGVLENLKEIKK